MEERGKIKRQRKKEDRDTRKNAQVTTSIQTPLHHRTDRARSTLSDITIHLKVIVYRPSHPSIRVPRIVAVTTPHASPN
jgi:hypothetical protein